MIDNFVKEYQTYRRIGEKALAQVPDEALNRVIGTDNNSVAVIVWHISGNLKSRFTDFLTSDGEKPWRHRDEEFDARQVTSAELRTKWEEGWTVLFRTLQALTDDDLQRTVIIRGEAFTVYEALHRSVTHTAYHVGQIVHIAK